MLHPSLIQRSYKLTFHPFTASSSYLLFLKEVLNGTLKDSAEYRDGYEDRTGDGYENGDGYGYEDGADYHEDHQREVRLGILARLDEGMIYWYYDIVVL